MIQTLELCDAMCPICLEILVEPVTLCCDHDLCKVCYENHFLKGDFKCPLCKTRLNSWARKKAKYGTMVNEEKWKQIQEQFGSLIERKESGQDTHQEFRSSVAKIAKPGEIYEEYKKLKHEWSSKRKAEDHEQEIASKNYIEELLYKEKQQVEKEKMQLVVDEEYAIALSKQLNPGPISISAKKKLRPCSSSRSPLKKRRCHGIQKYLTGTQNVKLQNDT
uniref:RING-type E3 ubiquitin transferase n=1 Tax=Phallusia mammillata TaxID=59560 RepID=A0A6F9DRV7_9ASCI|nr:ZF(RING)-238 zinc finger protein [Phallusia mammillata]